MPPASAPWRTAGGSVLQPMSMRATARPMPATNITRNPMAAALRITPVPPFMRKAGAPHGAPALQRSACLGPTRPSATRATLRGLRRFRLLGRRTFGIDAHAVEGAVDEHEREAEEDGRER